LTSSFFLIELIIILNNNNNDYFCKDWNKSLNNSYINNDPSLYPCKINIPSNKCLINIFGPFFDFSKIFNIKCEKRSYNEKNILINNSNLKNKTEVKKINKYKYKSYKNFLINLSLFLIKIFALFLMDIFVFFILCFILIRKYYLLELFINIFFSL
jgi:hypothetical protein